MQALPIISGVASAVGTVVSMQAAKAEGEYQAQVAENNRRIAEQNAIDTLKNTQAQARIQDQDARRQLDAIIASASASGLSGLVGSTALRVRTGEELAQRDRAFTMDAGEKQATGYRQQAENFRSEGEAARWGGQMRSFSALIGGISSFPSLISDAPKVAPAKSKALDTRTALGRSKWQNPY